MDTCRKCGAELGVGRFCLNCGHPIAEPVAETTTRTARVPRERHEAAAEAARGLGGPPASDTVEDASRVRTGSDGDWLLRDHDELDDDTSGPHWAVWVLGAAALVVAVVLALSFLPDDDSPATDEPRQSAPESATPGDSGTASASASASASPGSGEGEGEGERARVPRGPAVDVAREATVAVPATAPPTTDLDGTLVPYDAPRMVDGDPATAWRMPGDGTGATITFTLAEPAVVTRVGLVNGYAKRVEVVDWYPNNRRVLAVRWTFDDGTSAEQTLAEVPTLQRLAVPPVETGSVTLTLVTVTAPGVGELGRDYTAISSAVILGRSVG